MSSFTFETHVLRPRNSLKVKGTKTSMIKNQILISTGVVSLDAVLGKNVYHECSIDIMILSQTLFSCIK